MKTLAKLPSAGAQRAMALGPLLASIGREIRERSDALAQLLVQRDRGWLDDAQRTLIEADCSTHRRELRRANKELERLGCQLASSKPQVFRIDAGTRGEDSVLFWSCE